MLLMSAALLTALRASLLSVLFGLGYASLGHAAIIPADATDRIPVQLSILVADSWGQANELSFNRKPATVIIVGNEVRVSVYGNRCEQGCGVTLVGTYSFDLGVLPAGAYTVKLTHYYDDGVRILPDNLAIRDQAFMIRSSALATPAAPVPLSPLGNIVLGVLTAALVWRYGRR
jgi:hypothetical protein